VYSFLRDNKNYIFATYEDVDANNLAVVLKEFGGNWVEDYNKKGDYCTYCFEDIKVIEDNNLNEYIFYVTGSQGSGSGSFEFTLFSLRDNAEYWISVSGGNNGNGTISSDGITLSDNLKNDAEKTKILEDEIKKSKFVTSANENKVEDLTNNDAKNAQTKWIYDNGECRQRLYKNFSCEKFVLTPYKDNLFDIVGGGASVNVEKEDQNLLVRAYFKGSVIAYSKTTKNYYLIWVPDDMYDWVDQVTLTPTMIKIHERDTQHYIDVPIPER
jgi:hypothetical protein